MFWEQPKSKITPCSKRLLLSEQKTNSFQQRIWWIHSCWNECFSSRLHFNKLLTLFPGGQWITSFRSKAKPKGHYITNGITSTQYISSKGNYGFCLGKNQSQNCMREGIMSWHLGFTKAGSRANERNFFLSDNGPDDVDLKAFPIPCLRTVEYSSFGLEKRSWIPLSLWNQNCHQRSKLLLSVCVRNKLQTALAIIHISFLHLMHKKFLRDLWVH